MPTPYVGTVKLSGRISPSNIEDVYPVFDPATGLGSLRTVGTTAARDAITPQRREIGMVVYVTGGAAGETGYYALIGSTTANTSWTKNFTVGSVADQTTVDGVTGAVDLIAGSAISIATPPTAATKGITLTNEGVRGITLTAVANRGLAVSTVSGTNGGASGFTGTVAFAVQIDVNNAEVKAAPVVADSVLIGDDASGKVLKSVSVGKILDLITGDVDVSSGGTASIANEAIVNADINPAAAIAVTKLAAFTISGHTLGNNLSTLTIGNGLGGGSYNGSSAVTITNTGVTGIQGGTGISVSSATGNVTITNTGVQSLTLSASTNGGLAVSGAGTTGALTKNIAIDFANLTAVTPTTSDLVPVGDASDSNNPKDVTVGGILALIAGDVNVTSGGVSSIANEAIVNADINPAAAIAVTKLAAFTISGHTLGNNLSTLTIGNGLGGGSYNGSSAVTITNTGVTGIQGGTGISVSSQTGNVIITNTGVHSLAGTSNQITVTPSGGTGALTLSLPSSLTVPGSLTTTTDLTVGGNLTVNGTTTTVNSTTLTVEDSLVFLAKGNSAADSLDIGIYGLYDTTGSQDLYAGFFRDATDDKFKLFKGLQAAPTTTVNTAGTGYTVATLVANLEGTASTATNVTTTEANGTYYLAMASAVSSSTGIAVDTTATALTYSTNTSTLTAGTFSGSLSGNASSATNATNATNVIATEQTTGTMYLVGMGAAGTTGALLIDATAQSGLAALSYNNATATLTAYQVEAIIDGGVYT